MTPPLCARKQGWTVPGLNGCSPWTRHPRACTWPTAGPHPLRWYNVPSLHSTSSRLKDRSNASWSVPCRVCGWGNAILAPSRAIIRHTFFSMNIPRIPDAIWRRLSALLSGELRRAELGLLVSPHLHMSLLARRRATMIVNRVRLFAFLFAVLTPLWSVVDLVVFPFPLRINLAMM